MISLKQLYHEFPKQFWIVVGVHFIDKIGGTLVFPFFALYITHVRVGSQPRFAAEVPRNEPVPLVMEAEHG